MKTYRIHAPFYRQGVYYEAGATVVLDKGEKPHPSWVEVQTFPDVPESDEPSPQPKTKQTKKTKKDQRLFESQEIL